VEREVVEQIALEDLALLEMLQRIDQCLPLESGDTGIQQRLIESGLATFDTDMPRLTSAGIELCKSLQHRVAADAQAARILEQREAQAQAAADGGVEEIKRVS
jgi:hypothetical protein